MLAASAAAGGGTRSRAASRLATATPPSPTRSLRDVGQLTGSNDGVTRAVRASQAALDRGDLSEATQQAARRPEDEADGWFAPPATEPTADGPGVVGTATRVDGRGLAAVVVTVDDPAGRQEARTTTDDEGRYAVVLGGPGTYLVVAAAGAYQPHAALVTVGPDTATRHDVTLAGTSGVHGHVRHAGEPVGGAAVTLIDAQGDGAAVGVTDGSGHYRLLGVPDGAYTLTAASTATSRRQRACIADRRHHGRAQPRPAAALPPRSAP
jgi:hypothetical protein